MRCSLKYISLSSSLVLRLKQNHLECSPVAIWGELRLGSPKDLSLAKAVSTLSSNLESCPTSRGDHHHPATVTSKKSSKKVHLGHFIYGIKYLAHGQIAYNGKGINKTPATIFLFLYKEILEKTPLKGMIGVPFSCALMFIKSLCSSFGFFEALLNQLQVRTVSLLEPLQTILTLIKEWGP